MNINQFKCKSCSHCWSSDNQKEKDCPNCGSEEIKLLNNEASFLDVLKRNYLYFLLVLIGTILILFFISNKKNIKEYKLELKPICINGQLEIVVIDSISGNKANPYDFLFKIGGNGNYSETNKINCGYYGIVYFKLKNEENSNENSGIIDTREEKLCCDVSCSCETENYIINSIKISNDKFKVVLEGCSSKDITYSIDDKNTQADSVFYYPNDKIEFFKISIYCSGKFKDASIDIKNPNFKGALPPPVDDVLEKFIKNPNTDNKSNLIKIFNDGALVIDNDKEFGYYEFVSNYKFESQLNSNFKPWNVKIIGKEFGPNKKLNKLIINH
jgi:hypothetical protein